LNKDDLLKEVRKFDTTETITINSLVDTIRKMQIQMEEGKMESEKIKLNSIDNYEKILNEMKAESERKQDQYEKRLEQMRVEAEKKSAEYEERLRSLEPKIVVGDRGSYRGGDKSGYRGGRGGR